MSTPECKEFDCLVVGSGISGMTAALLAEYGDLPLVYAGGVMSNRLMRERLSAAFDAYFADGAFSADNAAGISLLCREKHLGSH